MMFSIEDALKARYPARKALVHKGALEHAPQNKIDLSTLRSFLVRFFFFFFTFSCSSDPAVNWGEP